AGGRGTDDGSHAHGQRGDGGRTCRRTYRRTCRPYGAPNPCMTTRSESRMERLLHQGVFCVTSEVVPPRGADPSTVSSQARGLVGYADAVNVTDNPTASAHMSVVAGSGLVAAAGLEPVAQVTCRDRNRLGLTSDLLGAWALGARNVLCLTGDPPATGDHPQTKGVYDLE